MTTTISFIIVLGILITAHELGHFLVAKAIGVGVERFSIGFPPRMLGFRRGETEYCISWIPLGGYVKLKGEGPDEEVDPSDPTYYSSRPPLHRAAIILAGPVMNLVLAFFVMPLVFMVGMDVPSYLEQPARVGWVMPDSPADSAGVRLGDEILSVNGEAVANWEALYELLARQAGKGATLVVRGEGAERSLLVDGGSLAPDKGFGALPSMSPVIGGLNPGYPAEEAGIQKGDLVVSVGGLPVSHWNEMAQVIHASAGKSMSIQVRREGKLLDFTVTPRVDERSGRGLVGIAPKTDTVLRRYPVVESIRRGVERNLELLGLTFRFVWDLLSLNASIKNLGGPIMIFQVTGEAARAGLSEFLAFMAFLSLQLGILNLFPIPVLDGGHLVFLGIEGAAGRPLTPSFRENAQKVGFVLLILLILVISYNDIIRLLARN